jgi:hypothetical protein
MPAKPMTDGELRSRLQPVVFVRLSDPLPGLPAFPAGEVVAVQYWGSGQLRVTSTRDPARTLMLWPASQLHGTWATWPGDTEVPDGD